jgi:hypothetical protein
VKDRFRVLKQPREFAALMPDSVPWALVEPLRARCLVAHAQSLETLDARGGLSPVELYAHVHELKFRDWMSVDAKAASAWLKEWSKE